MSHRIDIELTSAGEAGWTWRAAGARQPKGSLDPGLLYPGAAVGDVVRAEAERELEGIRIVSITPPKNKRTDQDRIEIVGRAPEAGGVNVTWAERSGERRDRRGPGRDRERPEGRDRDRGPRPDRGDRPERPRRERPAGAAGGGAGVGAGERPARPRPERPERPERAARPDVASRPKPKRFNPKRTHRDALIAELPPEQQPIAEQLLRGGIPAVRQAIIDQNAQLRSEGKTEVPGGPLLALAESLLPRTKQAEWLDRAAAALDMADDITLRDLRAVVTQADGVARDDASRDMARQLREALQRRIERERETWAADIATGLDEGRLVRAVRLSARIPDPGAKLPAELTARLVEATNAALSPDSPADRWAALIEAAAEAPFRRDVNPVGLPEKAGEPLLAAAAQASNRIPALLKLLGLAMPPPPRPRAAAPKAPAGKGPKATDATPAEAPAPAEAASEVAPAAAPPAETAPVEAAPVEAAATEAAQPEAPAADEQAGAAE